VRLTKNDRLALEKLHGLVMLKSEVLGVASSLVGNATEFKQLVKTLRGNTRENLPQLRQTEGWRKKFLEDYFRQAR
jgi:ribonuclease D